MKKIFFLIALWSIISAQYQQNMKINGYVVDSESGEAMPYANILIKDTPYGTMTNSDGYFALNGIPKETISIMVTYIGYETITETLTVKQIENGPLSLQISPRSLQGETVEVIAETYEIFKPSEVLGKMTLSTRNITTLPSIGEVDIFNSLKLLPGISGIGNGKSGIYVRGGTPDQNLVILDGMTVYHVDHFFGMFSAFNANAIKDVQVYKGGFPAKYGGRLSSVLELTGKRGGTEQNYTIGGSLLSGNMSYQTPVFDGLGSWIVTARRSYTDILQSGTYGNIYEFVTGTDASQNSQSNFRGGAFQQDVIPSFYYYDINSKLSFNPTGRDIFSLSFYTGRDFLDKSRELDFSRFGGGSTGGTEFETRVDENLSDWGNIGASFKWGHQWDLMYTNLLISGSQFNSIFERNLSVNGSNVVGGNSEGGALGLGAFAQNEYNKVNDYAIRLDNRLPIGNNNDVEFGLLLKKINTAYEANVSDSISIVNISSTSDIGAIYIQDNWKMTEKLDFTLGWRSTYFSPTNKFYNAPRISFGLNLLSNLTLKGAWGHYYQFINTITNEDVLTGAKEFWLSSDKNLLPGFAEHSLIGVSYDTENFLFEVEGYYKELENLVEFSRRFQDNADYNNYFFFGEGAAKGLEFLAQKKRGIITGWVSYTLGQAINTFPNLNGDKSFYANHDRNHELKLVGSYKIGKNWTLSSTYMFASGNPYTAPMNQYSLTMLDDETLGYIHVGEKNGSRLPDYNRVDISISRQWKSENGITEGGISLYNMFNNKNISYRDYDLDVSPIIASDVNMLGFTPTIFVNFKSR